jgi:hypothetical protein
LLKNCPKTAEGFVQAFSIELTCISPKFRACIDGDFALQDFKAIGCGWDG